MSIRRNPLTHLMLLAALLFAATGALAQSASPGDGLLAVTQAFSLKARTDTPGKVALHFDIAPHYYLYRGRIHAKMLTPGVTAGKLALPPGTPEHDPFLGDVAIYHGQVDATLPYHAKGNLPKTLKVAVTYQGCHEVAPKICYPPHTQTLVLPVGTAAVAAANRQQAARSHARATLRQRGLIPWIAEPGPGSHPATPGKLLQVSGAQAKGKPLPADQAFMVDAIARSPTELLLRWTMPRGYYIYRDHTALSLDDTSDVTLGDPRWPPGVLHQDPYFGQQIVYFDEVDLPVPLRRPAADDARTVSLRVTFQGCQNGGLCYPAQVRTLKVHVPAASQHVLQNLTKTAMTGNASPGNGLLPVTQAFAFKASVDKPGHIALHWDIAPHYYLYRGRIHAKILGKGVSAGKLDLPPGQKEHDQFLGDVEIYHGAVDGSLPYTVAGAMPATLQLAVSYQGCHETEPQICYPPHTETVTLPTAGGGPTATTTGNGSVNGGTGSPLSTGLAFALLLAFVGGLILNLMPCVLPILAVKAVGVLESNTDRVTARRHALAYGAGVIATFLAIGLVILGLRSAGHAVGWGTQLQQPWIVAVLACVLFAVGLSMSGVVAFGTRFGNLGAGWAQRGGSLGHFFTGVLAVIVASPCTAPFMGVALAYAFVAPASHELLVMLALGIGLALPLVLIGLIPALARLLPKPGHWMETLKQILAFPMYLSAVWLVWVLAHQRGADAVALVLIAMVLLGAALWWHGRGHPERRFGHAFTVVLLLAAVVPIIAVARLAPPARAAMADSGAVPFSPAKLAALRKTGTPVFVDISADWCITCKVNEHAVLDTQGFRKLLASTGTIYMKGDWTDVDPEIGAYLKQFHSPGVPLYVVYPRGDGPGHALPTVLTASLVHKALVHADMEPAAQ